MPRIPTYIMDSVAFLYPTRRDAERHSKVGGTCFLIGDEIVESNIRTSAFIGYLVSNVHVVRTNPVVRINRRDGGQPEIIELQASDWTFHHMGDDVAIVGVGGKLTAIHKITFISTERLVTQEQIQELQIDVGEDAFMIGRFVNHQGRFENRPAARFGNVSMMVEPIHNPAIGKHQDSFAVEMRSRTGFSGSPVFVYRTPLTALDEDIKYVKFAGLLGVNWGYIIDENTQENTWLNGVVPAWKILEMLERPLAKERRQRAIEKFRRIYGGPAEASSIEPLRRIDDAET